MLPLASSSLPYWTVYTVELSNIKPPAKPRVVGPPCRTDMLLARDRTRHASGMGQEQLRNLTAGLPSQCRAKGRARRLNDSLLLHLSGITLDDCYSIGKPAVVRPRLRIPRWLSHKGFRPERSLGFRNVPELHRLYREQAFLMPPSLRDWLAEDHLRGS